MNDSRVKYLGEQAASNVKLDVYLNNRVIIVIVHTKVSYHMYLNEV